MLSVIRALVVGLSRLGIRLAGFASLGAGLISLFRVKSAKGAAIMVFKLAAGTLAPFAAHAGAAAGLLALALRMPLTAAAAGYGAFLSWRHARAVLAARGDFAGAFGPGWYGRIPAPIASRMLRRRWSWVRQADPEPRFDQNVVFWTPDGSGRELLCDIWQPSAGVEPSGLAFIYLHGSAWHYLDKDVMTRPFFSHLAAQGHVVMDVAYRLCPEVDIYEMLGDAKRAVAWMKEHSSSYGVDPGRIVVGGGSAGAHLALLAAYTPGHPRLTTPDVQGIDTSVRGVVSFYGPADLFDNFRHTHHLLPGEDAEEKLNPLMRIWMRLSRTLWSQVFAGGASPLYTVPATFSNLIGGTPDQVPDVAELASPVSHVSPASPPTLLFHGSHDTLVSVEPTRALYQKLRETGVPSVFVEFPQTEHGFDLSLPPVAPGAQSSLYDIDRFLGLMAGEPGDARLEGSGIRDQELGSLRGDPVAAAR